ncbi:MAG: acyl carrier protein [Hyphomicrobium sp.]|jgi:acyl carrier protein
MTETIKERVRRVVDETYLAGLGVDPADVDGETDLYSLGGDSLDVVELTANLELEFDINSLDDVEFSTINEITTHLEGLCNGKHI